MKLSETLRQRVEETNTEIATLEARLSALLTEKEGILGAPTVDSTALQRLEQEEATIPVTVVSLQTRCTLLAGQIGEAETAEAHARMGAIAQETAALAARRTARADAWRTGIADLLALLAAEQPDRRRHEELQAEAHYLHEAFAAPWPAVPPLVALRREDLSKLEAQFNKLSWLFEAGGEWNRKTQELWQQRAHADRAAREADRKPFRVEGKVTVR